MVLVILIALWAMVLLPPYLKDRRASGRTFRSMSPMGSASATSTNSAQRFLPLQQASGSFSTSAVSSPTGMRTTGVRSLGATNLPSAHLASNNLASNNLAPANLASNNVVQLRPVAAEPASHVPSAPRPLATSAAAYLEETPLADEALLHQAWDTPASAGLRVPTSTAAARERRRQVLLAMTGIALVTLLFAIFAGGRWIAAHVLVDMLMLGYVILLVRHRQLAADRMMKVEPIRPPVNEQAPASVQLAPSYLLRSNTGS